AASQKNFLIPILDLYDLIRGLTLIVRDRLIKITVVLQVDDPIRIDRRAAIWQIVHDRTRGGPYHLVAATALYVKHPPIIKEVIVPYPQRSRIPRQDRDHRPDRRRYD